MEETLRQIEQNILRQVCVRLKSFEQNLLFLDIENYFSPQDLIISLTPFEYNILCEVKNEQN